MREIKFRAWYKETDTRTEFDRMYYSETDYENLSDFFREWGIASKLEETHASYLMQYTGLKDKNGKEIYEGDFLTFIFPNNGNKGIAPVVWEYGCWNVTDFKNNAGSNNIYNLYPSTDCEIIGNIYENSELLEETNS